MIIDLHTHSTASDGRLSPSALVAAACAAGINVLALTDHDTIDGLDEAARAAAAAGIRFIRGVEIEIDWVGAGEHREFHLLGLGFDRPSAKLRQILLQLRHKREKRNRLIIDRVNAHWGVDVSLDEIRAFCGASYIGRPHIADYLIQKKLVRNTEEAFRKYLGVGKPLYVSQGGVRLRRAISAIQESGGITVLAHPTSLYLAWGRLPGVLAQLRQTGLDGIEVFHPIATRRASERLGELAQQLDFYVSAGSDFHGGTRRDRKLGCGPGGQTLTAECVRFPSPIMEAWGLNPAALPKL